MPDNTRRRKQIDAAIEKAVHGDKKPAAPRKTEREKAIERAKAQIELGHRQAQDSRIYGVELGKKAARNLVQGTIKLNRLRRNQHTDSHN